MTSEWRPVLDARPIAGGTVQTIRAGMSNETGHDVALNGRTIRVLPDGVTTARKRSYIISEAPAAVRTANERLVYYAEVDRTITEITPLDPVAYLVGCLLLAGAHRLTVDGVDLVPTTPGVQARIDVLADGSVLVTRTGGVG